MCGRNVDYKENILVGGVLINNAVYKPSDEWKLKDFHYRTTAGAIVVKIIHEIPVKGVSSGYYPLQSVPVFAQKPVKLYSTVSLYV